MASVKRCPHVGDGSSPSPCPLLQVAELSHSVTSPMSFRVEYKRGATGPMVFQRHVRFQVDITPVCPPNDPNPLYAINFILLQGMMGTDQDNAFVLLWLLVWTHPRL